MDAVISRIIEIEKESARDLERAEEASREKIEAHRLALEAEKERTHSDIVSAENNRFSQTILEARKQTETATESFLQDSERPFSDPATMQTIKDHILSILLEG